VSHTGGPESEKIVNIRDIFPSAWVSAEDLGNKKFELEIATVSMEPVHDPTTNREVKKLVVAFVGAKKRLIVNKTQALSLANITGSDETDEWAGKRVALRAGIAPNRKATIVIEPAAVQAPAPALDNPFEDEPVVPPVAA
jgi:hypothetical protein